MKTCLLFLLSVAFCFATPSIKLDKRLVCDLEMLIDGAFDPLDTFLSEKDYHSVLDNCRLLNGKLWTMPIVLPITQTERDKIGQSRGVILCDDEHFPIAELTIEEMYQPDVEKECLSVFGSTEPCHPYISRILSYRDSYYLTGRLKKVASPRHFSHTEYRLTPAECRQMIKESGWKKVVGFQTRNPLHRCHLALTRYCMGQAGEDAKLLLQPVVGITQPGDIEPNKRIECYKALIQYYPENSVKLSLLPLSMRMAGPREAVWHAQIRKNYGCTHFVVGRDHAGPSVRRSDGTPFFHPYAAHSMLKKYKDDLGIQIVTSKEIVYVPELKGYFPADEVPEDASALRISGTEFRRMLKENLPIPPWFSFPEVIKILKSEFRKSEGVCVYLTGLSGSGKTTLCKALEERINATSGKPVVILDGDNIRKYLSNGLGFSKKDRSINVRRIGYVASLIVKSGGICLCANIAPYEEDRQANRQIISNEGKYIEVFVNTPLTVCEDRDVKGLYRLAREGKITQFTGISDPYEIPVNAEIVLDSSKGLPKVVENLIQDLEKRAPQLFKR